MYECYRAPSTDLGNIFVSRQPEEPWRNRLLGKHDVCLMNVDAIYQLSSSGKRKLLPPRSNVAGRVKELQIRCKVRSGWRVGVGARRRGMCSFLTCVNRR